MNISGIYVIKNVVNGKFYLGQSQQLNKRKSVHFTDLRFNRHRNKHLQRAYNRYGESNFKFEVIVNCSPDELMLEEQKLLDLYGNTSLCYNIATDATAPMRGRKHSEVTKSLIAAGNRGRSVSKETRGRLSAARKGKGHSDEVRRRIGLAHFGSKSPRARSVIQLTLDDVFVKSWECISDAERAVNPGARKSSGNITACAQGKSLSAYGYRWKFVNSIP
jgi:group I intron endonuclease